MLNIYYGEMPGAIYNTAVYFKNVYEDDWITQSFSREMIADVDRSSVLENGVIDSPVLGKIPPLGLSGGTKTLILIANVPDKVFNASTCGDNCAKWLLKMGKEKDVTVNLRHLMDFGAGDFELRILNTGQTVHNMSELAGFICDAAKPVLFWTGGIGKYCCGLFMTVFCLLTRVILLWEAWNLRRQCRKLITIS